MRWSAAHLCTAVVCVFIAGLPSYSSDDFSRRTYLDGIDVRCVTRGADGTVWIGTGRGAFVLPKGSEAPVPCEAEPLADAEINDIIEDGMGVLWFCTASGLVRHSGDSFVVVNETEIPVDLSNERLSSRLMKPDGGPPDPLHEIGEVLCAAASEDGLWFATRQAVVRYIPQTDTWSAQTHYAEWGPVVGGYTGIFARPLQGCQQIVADHAGVLWALIEGGLITADPTTEGWAWATGYELQGIGGSPVRVRLPYVAHHVRLGNSYSTVRLPQWGLPTALALNEAGEVQVLTDKGYVLSRPRGAAVLAPQVDLAGLHWSARGAAWALAVSWACVAVVGPADFSVSPNLLIAAVDGKPMIATSVGGDDAAVRDMLFCLDGQTLVATDRGLVAVTVPLPAD